MSSPFLFLFFVRQLVRKNESQKFYAHSLQGDSAFERNYYSKFLSKYHFDAGGNKITLLPDTPFSISREICFDMNDCPDIAQTVCNVLRQNYLLRFLVLGTLERKETDRLINFKMN